jgi:hypothetical protein
MAAPAAASAPAPAGSAPAALPFQCLAPEKPVSHRDFR